MTTDQIIQIEDQHQLPTYAKLPIAIERGEGPYVFDAEGRRYIDFYGGHCVSILGHSPAPVVDAIREQAGRLLFYSNIVYNSTRAEAARIVTQLAPAGLDKVFFCNSGTEANETALKMARKFTGKSTILAMEGGFHGRTLGSLAATHGIKYREPYLPALGPTEFAPFGDPDAVARILERNSDVAAVILEPIQSMAGMRTADPAYFQSLETLCREYGALLIFDEVQTGCGRTGPFSYAETVGVTPSMITLAKSLGSGVPVGATLVHESVAATVEIGDQGSTFGGGMLAMAAVTATLATIVAEGLQERAIRIEAEVRKALDGLVTEIRGAGCLLGIELDDPVSPVTTALRSQGLLVGGSSDPKTMRLMPPLNCPDETLQKALQILSTTLAPTTITA